MTSLGLILTSCLVADMKALCLPAILLKHQTFIVLYCQALYFIKNLSKCHLAQELKELKIHPVKKFGQSLLFSSPLFISIPNPQQSFRGCSRWRITFAIAHHLIYNDCIGVGDNICGGATDLFDSATGIARRSEGKLAAMGGQKTEGEVEGMIPGDLASQAKIPASDVVTVQDIHSQRAAGNYRYGAPTESASGGI